MQTNKGKSTSFVRSFVHFAGFRVVVCGFWWLLYHVIEVMDECITYIYTGGVQLNSIQFNVSSSSSIHHHHRGDATQPTDKNKQTNKQTNERKRKFMRVMQQTNNNNKQARKHEGREGGTTYVLLEYKRTYVRVCKRKKVRRNYRYL